MSCQQHRSQDGFRKTFCGGCFLHYRCRPRWCDLISLCFFRSKARQACSLTRIMGCRCLHWCFIGDRCMNDLSRHNGPPDPTPKSNRMWLLLFCDSNNHISWHVRPERHDEWLHTQAECWWSSRELMVHWHYAVHYLSREVTIPAMVIDVLSEIFETFSFSSVVI